MNFKKLNMQMFLECPNYSRGKVSGKSMQVRHRLPDEEGGPKAKNLPKFA